MSRAQPALPLDLELARATERATLARRNLHHVTALWVARQATWDAWQVAKVQWGQAVRDLTLIGGPAVVAHLLEVPRFENRECVKDNCGDLREHEKARTDDSVSPLALTETAAVTAGIRPAVTQVSPAGPVTPVECDRNDTAHPFSTGGGLAMSKEQRLDQRTEIVLRLEALNDRIGDLEAERMDLDFTLRRLDCEDEGLAGPLDDGPGLDVIAEAAACGALDDSIPCCACCGVAIKRWGSVGMCEFCKEDGQ